MTTSSRPSNLYQVGERLSVYLQRSDIQVSDAGKIRFLLADLVGSQVDMLIPLQDLVSRPAFAAMMKTLGGTNKSSLNQVQRQSQALLKDLSNTFTPVIVSGLADVLSGLLEKTLALTPSQLSLRPQSLDLRPIAPASQDPRVDLPLGSAPPNRFTSEPSFLNGVAPVNQPMQPSNGNRSLRFLMLILGFLLGAASLMAAGVIVLRNPQYCEALSLCQPQRLSPETLQALDDAEKAYQDLVGAKDLATYRRSYSFLEREFLRLSGDRLLPDQEQKYRQYKIVLARAKEIISEEERIQGQLDQVVLLLDRSRAADAGDQLFYLDQADHILSAISDKSFVFDRVGELKAQLSALRTQFTAAPSPTQSIPCMPADSLRCRPSKLPPLPPLPPNLNGR
jgi:hypothetical protein